MRLSPQRLPSGFIYCPPNSGQFFSSHETVKSANVYEELGKTHTGNALVISSTQAPSGSTFDSAWHALVGKPFSGEGSVRSMAALQISLCLTKARGEHINGREMLPPPPSCMPLSCYLHIAVLQFVRLLPVHIPTNNRSCSISCDHTFTALCGLC